jgi:EpsI family protein
MSPAWRLLLIALCLSGTALLSAGIVRPESVPLRDPLALIPKDIAGWTGHDAPAFAPDILDQLGVDEYVNRVYLSATAPLSLYVGYYESQRAGDTMHSPQNCLPGAGWLPVTTSRLTLAVAGRSEPVTINRLLIQKGTERQVVLYWYQSHGRVVASDYWSKAFLVYDAIRRNRSDAAMVRVISPVLPSDEDAAAAEQRAAGFVEEILPQLDRFLPI